MKSGFRKPRAIVPSVQLPKSTPNSHGHPQACLNCGAALVGAYCHDCGQSAHTHRMSFKHFLLHDFVHGVWHLDKGFPATIKKAFVNPGKEIREYLAGKRAGWFSILTTIVLLAAVTGFLDAKIPDEPFEVGDTQRIVEFLDHTTTWILLGSSFVFALSSAFWFRRLKLNLSEHTILNAFFLIGILGINLLDTCIEFLIAKDTGVISFLFMFPYLTYAYYNAFGKDFTFSGWLWRYLAHWVTSIALFLAIAAISTLTYLAVTGKNKIEIDTIHKTKSTNHAPAAP